MFMYLNFYSRGAFQVFRSLIYVCAEILRSKRQYEYDIIRFPSPYKAKLKTSLPRTSGKLFVSIILCFAILQVLEILT